LPTSLARKPGSSPVPCTTSTAGWAHNYDLDSPMGRRQISGIDRT
jgi:hypothetical protein